MIFSSLGISEENEVPTVRQERGPAMRFLSRVDFCRQRGRAALRVHFHQTSGSSKQNDTVAIPGSASVISRVADCLRSTSGRINLEYLAVREVADVAAIR